MGADFIEESTPQNLCGPQIALEGALSLYSAPSLRISERSNPQISAFVDKYTFLLIIFVNSHCVILASYYVKENAWFLLCLTKDTFLRSKEERQKETKRKEN